MPYNDNIDLSAYAGQTGYIRIWEFGTISQTGDFQICVVAPDNSGSEDFYVQDQWVSEPTVAAGETIDVSASQCYSGSKLDSEMGNVYLGYYLSTNTTFGSSDKPLEESPSSLGSDNRCSSESETVTIPVATAPGNYNILFVADDDDYFNETDENNNVNYIPITVTAGTGKPDLTINYISYTPETITPGTLVLVNYTKSNIGNLDAPTNSIGIYISSDDVFDPNTDEFLDDWTNGGPKAGASYTDLLNFKIPNCYACGTYFIFLFSDYKNVVDESDDSNNYDSFQIQITGCTTCSYSVPANGINFQSAGGSGNFNVTTTECCEWTASTTDNFITIINSSGIGNGVVNYSVSPSNSGGTRTGTIKVGDYSHTITQNCVEVCNNSQTFEWAVKAGSTTHSDNANDLAIDDSENIYMTGSIQNVVTFGGGITLTTPSTAPDIFVSKHNSSGQIQWAVRYGDTDQEYGTGIAADNSGNVYVIGNSQNEVTFENTTLTANGKNEGIAFLLKLNSSGEFQWAKKLNELYDGGASDIVIDKNNNIFITGNLSDYNQDGNGNGFYLAKYNTSGIQAWYNSYGFGFYIKQAFGIATDNLGNLFISGRYMQTMTLGSTTMKASATLDMDGFISKLDVNGNVIWAKQLTSPGQGQDELRSIAVDVENNIYTIGKVDSTAIVGNISIPLLDKKSKTVIIKYDQNGNPLWAKTSNIGQQYNQQKILTGNDGNIYFAGCFYSAMKLDTIIITGFGSNDAFIGCIDINGTIKWLKGFGGSQDDGLGGIVTNSNNDIFVAGEFSASAVFGNATLTSSGRGDIFLAKFKKCDPPKANIVYSESLVICPGESKSLETEYCSSYRYQWAKNNINILEATLPTYIATETGSYTVIVSSAEGCETISSAVSLTEITVNKPIITQNGNLLLSTIAASYQWNLNDNPINGATSQFYEPLVSGEYSVSVTYSSGCSAISDIIVIKENQTIIFDILPSKTVCDLKFDLIASVRSELPVTFISSNKDVATISGNKVTITGAGTTEITASQSGNNDYNAAPSIKRTLTVTENSNFIPEITVNGAKTFCIGDSVTLTASLANSYQWNNNATTQSIVVKESGNYSVTLNMESGCEKTSTVTTIVANTAPTNAGAISGITNVTKNQTNISYSVSTIPNAKSYIWKLPSGATGTSTTNNINVIFGNNAESGEISMKGSNDCGDGLESLLFISVNKTPIANAGQDQSVNEEATVSLDGSLSSDADGNPLTYKWTAPAGITLSSSTDIKPTFTVPEVKKDSILSFYLMVNDGLENSAQDTVNITVINVIKVGNSEIPTQAFKVYPNPTTGMITLEFTQSTGKKTEISVSNLIGAEVFRKEFDVVEKFEVDLSNQVSGIYFLNVVVDNQQYISKIVLARQN
jgi:hypothetical protein